MSLIRNAITYGPGGGGGGSFPVPNYASNYLSAVSVAPRAYGMKAMVSAAKVNLFRLRDNADTTDTIIQNLGVPATRPDLPDWAAMAAAIGGTAYVAGAWTGDPTARVSIVYAQDGSGVDYLQPTFANMMGIDLNQCFQDVPYLLKDGVSSDVNLPATSRKYMSCNHATNSWNGGSFFATVHPLNSYVKNCLMAVVDPAGPSTLQALWIDQPASSNNRVFMGGILLPVARSQPQVVGVNNTPFGQRRAFIADTEITPGFATNSNLTGLTFYIGWTPECGSPGGTVDQYNNPSRYLGWTYHPPAAPGTPLSVADLRKVHDDHINMFGLDHDVRAWVAGDVSTFTDRIIMGGDSKNSSVYAEKCRGLISAILDRRVKQHIEWYDVAVSGQTQNQETSTGATNPYTFRFAPLYSAVLGSAHNKLLLECGHNDIFATHSSAAAVVTDRTAFYTKANTTGFKVGSFSLLPTTAVSVPDQASRATFNGAGAASFQAPGTFDFLVDEGNNAGLSNAADVTLYPDGTHPTGKANKLRAAIVEAVV